MKKVLTSVIAVVMLSIPGVAFAQQPAKPAAAKTAFRESLDASTARAIDWREIEKRFEAGGRSGVLLSLYGSLAALNVLDVVSSRRAIARGGVERNPLMKDAIGNNNLSLGIKAASTLGTVVMIDRIAKKNRKAAIVTAVLANGVTAAIVANNFRQGRR